MLNQGENKMPFCGFDEQMLEGLEKFHLGLIENIVGRAEKVRETEISAGGSN